MRLLATCYDQKLRLGARRHGATAVEGEDDAAQYLDQLCLILGLLSNLVQTSEEAKELIGDISEFEGPSL